MRRGMRHIESLCTLLLTGALLLGAGVAWAIESDDDMPTNRAPANDGRYVSVPTAPVQAPTAPVTRELRVGLLEMRPNFEAERAIPESVRLKMAADFQAALGDINARPKIVIPTASIMKMLGPREKAQYDTCWVDAACLGKALESAGLDIALVGKLRMKELEGSVATAPALDSFGHKVENHVSGEFSLFMRLVDLKQGRTMREFVVTHTDYTRLGELGVAELHKNLVSAGLLVADPREAAANLAVAPVAAKEKDDLDVTTLKALAEPPRQRPKLYKAFGFTTLALGLVAEGLGGTFGYLSKKKQDDEKKVAVASDFKSLRDDRKKYMILANSMYGTGGAFLISSVVLLTLGYLDQGQPDGAGGGVFITRDGVMVGAHTRF